MGTTVAVLHDLGNVPSFRQREKIMERGAARDSAQFLRSAGWWLSGPGEEEALRAWRWRRTKSLVMRIGELKGPGWGTGALRGRVGLTKTKRQKQETNCLNYTFLQYVFFPLFPLMHEGKRRQLAFLNKLSILLYCLQ